MKTKLTNPIEEVWRIRDELAAEEGNDPRKVFAILRREETKYRDRVRSPPREVEAPALIREEPPPYGGKSRRKP